MDTHWEQYVSNLYFKPYKNYGYHLGNIQDSYYKQFKLYLYVFRIFGRIPFESTSPGVLEVSYFSGIAIYSVVVFILQLYGLFLILLWQIQRVQDDNSFDNVISSILVLLFFNFHFDIFFFSWWEAPKLVAYFESWKKFDITLMIELGISVPSDLVVKIKSVVFTTGSTLFIMTLFEMKFLLEGLDWYLCLPLFIVAYNATLLSTYWYFNCLMMCQTTNELNSQFLKVLKGNPYRHQVYKFRRLILQMRIIAAEFGNVLSRTVVSAIFTFFLSLVLALYGVIIIALQEKFDRLLSLILPFVYSLVNILVYCEGSYQLIDKITSKTLKEILKCKFVALRSEVHQEIELILETIKKTPIDIEPLGLFKINRHTFFQVCCIAVSYLIVLAQFRETDEKKSK